MKYKYIKVYKSTWCADCRIADIFFEENNIKVNEVINIDEDSVGAKRVLELNNGYKSVPTIIIEMEDMSNYVLVEPSWSELYNFFIT